ncbi:unnamed protein product [Rhizoctonia solani]|uniref:Uncharacterized protein n=1 Tax=Rhizoctonia solani TaxID=456999 RepID=A0A8H3H3K4_9AGAM|nr:unnamed protein product [Rhizoctonia solani]
MKLLGAGRDEVNIKGWLTADKRFPGLKIRPVEKTLREDIKVQMDQLAMINPGAIFVYSTARFVHNKSIYSLEVVQGHGFSDSLGCYVTGDPVDPENHLTTVKSEELIQMFSEFGCHTRSIVITDFCHSGNFFRLPYKLELSKNGTGPEWIETEGTSGSDTGPNKLASPMIHLAGSTRDEQVMETGRIGGYFTDGLSKIGTKKLPELLAELRAEVNVHLEQAKSYPGFTVDARQTPQIYSSSKLSLDDPDILTKFYLQEIKSHL